MKHGLIKASSLFICVSFSSFSGANWPDLPTGIKNGVSAQVGNTLFVGLGSTQKEFFSLDLNNLSKGWKKQADFIGPARDGSTATAIGDSIYVFGGSGKANKEDQSPIVFNTIYRYQTKMNKWEQINSNSPVGLLGASSYSPNQKEIIFFGGYNKAYFDEYLASVTSIDKSKNPNKWKHVVDDYMGMEPQDYQWNKNVISFNPSTQSWENLGENINLPNCGAAIVSKNETAVLVSGEIKPGLRTAQVKKFQFGSPSPWTQLSELPSPKGQNLQEGVAGAYAGLSNNAMIVFGGANFHGAQKEFKNGKMYAHDGLSKSYNPQIYVYQNKDWKQVNDFPKRLAYGSSFSLKDGLLVVGGEDQTQTAIDKVYLLKWNGKNVDIID